MENTKIKIKSLSRNELVHSVNVAWVYTDCFEGLGNFKLITV